MDLRFQMHRWGNLKAGGKVLGADNFPFPIPLDTNGYYYRILTKQGAAAKGGAKETGGFAILAYSVEYRNTGIMTFIYRKRWRHFPKGFGRKAMTEYNPGECWSPAV